MAAGSTPSLTTHLFCILTCRCITLPAVKVNKILNIHFYAKAFLEGEREGGELRMKVEAGNNEGRKKGSSEMGGAERR
jgi:hypothetical protein